MLPGVLYVASIALSVLIGNALNRFGLKYALPAVLLPVAGLLFSVLRLRDHVLRARLAANGTLPNEHDGPIED
jgi:hypothetical protein